MVKKLFKHELHAYWRVLVPVWGLLMGVAVLGRLIQLFESDTIGYNIVRGSTIFFYVAALVVALLFPFVFAIMRFHKNLFTGEGYLSLTLPVTNFQHILVKVGAGFCLQLGTVLVCLLSAMTITLGDVLSEVFKAIDYLIPYFYYDLKWGANLPFFLVEGLLLLMVAYVSEILLYYACITVGQMSKKNRLLAAFGVYFGYYFVRQVVGTILVVIGAFIDWEPLLNWVDEHVFTAVHLGLCGGIVFYSLILTGYFAITHSVMRHRLNLE